MKLDPLEPRKLLAAAIDAGRLLVEGTGGDDKIAIALHPNFINVVVVDLNGTGSYFSLDSITSIDIRSGDGNDQINTISIMRDANDSSSVIPTIVRGGAGDDKLYASNSSQITLFGNEGNDRITAKGGAILAYGGEGDDYIVGNSSSDTLWGQDGNDVLNGGADTDYLFGGDGNDTLFGGIGADIIKGENGNDELYASDPTNAGKYVKENDQGYGGAGRDWFDGAPAWKKIDFNAAEDTAVQFSVENPKQSLLGVGSLIKTSAGTLTLSGSGTYSGVVTNVSTIGGSLGGIRFNSSTSLLNIHGVGYLFDGTGSAVTINYDGPSSASSTPAPIDLSTTRLEQINPHNLILPKGWRVSQEAIRQGNVVWYRLKTKTADFVNYNSTPSITARYLAVKTGTLLITNALKTGSSPTIFNSSEQLLLPTTATVLIAGDTKAHQVSDQFQKLPKVQKGKRGILLNDGVIWLDATGSGSFSSF